VPQFDLSRPFAETTARLAQTQDDLDRVRSRAIGTLARRLPVQARRDMQDEYNLPASRIAAGLSTRREEGAVVLIGRKRGIGLIEFGGRWRGRKAPGATARVRNSGGAETYAGSFIARMLGGNRQIVQRETRKRLPLRVLYGPSIADMLKNADRRARLGDFAQDIAASELDRLTRGRK